MYVYSSLITDENFTGGSTELGNIFIDCFDGSMTAEDAEDAIAQLEEEV